jgi:rRNA maturation protein Nop10
VSAWAYTVWRVDCDCGSVIEYGEDDSTLPETCEECGDDVEVQR